MNKQKKIIEHTKTAIIIVLTISMFLLGWQSNLFNEFFLAGQLFGNFAGADRAVQTAENGTVLEMEAARPLVIVITHEEGWRFGVKYQTDLRNTVYDWTSGIIGEALGSASGPIQITQAEWREALNAPGVYFEYIAPVRLSILDGWLGARMAYIEEDVLLRRIFVAFGNDSNRLYFQNYYTNAFYVADTASFARKAPELEMLQPNNVRFAFETGVLGAENSPYMIIMPDTLHPNIAVASAGAAEELLYFVRNAFGHGREADRTYFDGETLVSVGAHFNIRIEPSGRVLYRRTDGYHLVGGAVERSGSELIELARKVVSNTIGTTSGAAEVFFETLMHTSDYTAFATFGYYIAGGRVRLYDDTSAAKISFENGIIMEAELLFRSYSFTDEYTELWPEVFALAAAGGEFMLSFPDAGLDVITPVWLLAG